MGRIRRVNSQTLEETSILKDTSESEVPKFIGKVISTRDKIEALALCKKLAIMHTPEAISVLAGLMRSKSENMRYLASVAMMTRGLGKPAQEVDPKTIDVEKSDLTDAEVNQILESNPANAPNEPESERKGTARPGSQRGVEEGQPQVQTRLESEEGL